MTSLESMADLIERFGYDKADAEKAIDFIWEGLKSEYAHDEDMSEKQLAKILTWVDNIAVTVSDYEDKYRDYKVKEIHSFDGLLRKMTEIAQRKVEYYLTDFLVHDTSQLYEADKSGEPFNFVWLVRDFGTHMINLDKAGWKEIFDCVWGVYENDFRGVYLVSKNTLIDITGSYEDVLAEIKDYME